MPVGIVGRRTVPPRESGTIGIPQAAAFVLLSRTGGRLSRGARTRVRADGVVGRATPTRTYGIPDAR
ncbi:hypothetical protein GCM10010104_44700 [Streptomyces indiaensis]|uniref:Uncharacterized protein n=1 Tax=Streptomyces indiaensis TaxID=284033 RepID=A0ABP5QSN4_9ACTN